MNTSSLLKRLAVTISITIIAVSQPLSANMHIRFVESAPKDWFSLTNNSECELNNVLMKVDLSNSAGKLIFDTTASGAGVEVFQPFEKREGDIKLVNVESINDGEKVLTVLIGSLAPGKSASFTIDVDDTLTNSELGNIRVSQSEIKGGSVSVTVGNMAALEGVFSKQGKIELPSPQC